MIPDPDAMIFLAKKLETAAHRQGWDQEATLGIVFDIDGGYRTTPFPAQPAELDPNPAMGLLMLAEGLYRNTGYARRQIREHNAESGGRDLAGLWFISEGWMRPPELADDERAAADIPGTKEVRFLTLLDCAGVTYNVQRVRGEKPTMEVIKPGCSELETHGNVFDGLRRMLLALGSNMPDGSIDMEAVATVGTEGDME